MKVPVRSEIYFQAWVLIAGITMVVVYMATDLGFVWQVIEADRSRLCILIGGLFVGSTAHAAWHIIRVTHLIRQATAWLSISGQQDGKGPSENEDRQTAASQGEPASFLGVFVDDVIEARRNNEIRQNSEPSLVLEIHADRLRAAVDIGWYLVDILIRLGLLGTIIGFILILGTLSSGPEPTPENIQRLLISMSGGMGTALYTTLAGLVTAMALGTQYMVLARGTEDLIAMLVRIRDRVGVP